MNSENFPLICSAKVIREGQSGNAGTVPEASISVETLDISPVLERSRVR